VSFLPAVSKDAIKAMGREIRSWHIARRSDKSLTDLALMFNSIVQGWINYYGRFYKSMLYPLAVDVGAGQHHAGALLAGGQQMSGTGSSGAGTAQCLAVHGDRSPRSRRRGGHPRGEPGPDRRTQSVMVEGL
jgi:hypothetical protein